MNPLSRLSLLVSLLALVLMPAHTAVGQDDASYTGVITQERVDVRSGAGRAYYVVGELEQGQAVTVVDVLFDATWYKIAVPGGVYSYVSKVFIDAEGDGSTGVVNADRTEFKAASLRGPGESYRVQGTFSEGDRVEIVGEEGNFYKIAAPTEAYVFIPAGTVRRATTEDLADATPAGADEADAGTTDEPTEQPEEQPDEQPEPVRDPELDALEAALGGGPAVDDAGEAVEAPEGAGETADTGDIEEQMDPATDGDRPEVDETSDTAEGPRSAEATDEAEATDAGTDEGAAEGDAVADAEEEGDRLPAKPDVEVSTPARSDALKAVELDLLPYFHVAIEDRPLDHMEQGYRDVLATGDLSRVDQQIVEVRLRTIARQREILAAMQRVEAARQQREPRTEVPDLATLPRTPVEYQAVGMLQVSSVYDGQTLPRMYRLVDPSGRTVAYVAPSSMIDESDLLNTLVGVVGTSTYDSALKLQIITPQRVDALAAE